MQLIPEDSREFPICENGLSEKQMTAVEMLVSGVGYGQVARTLSIDPKTLYNWREEELFQEALRERRRELWGRAGDRIRALLHPSIDVMEAHLKDKYDRSRFRAASTMLRLANLRATLPVE